MTYYADIVKPIANRKMNWNDVEVFAAVVGGVVIEDTSWNRSIVNIYNAEEDFTYECRTVLAKCSACGRRFQDITFTDNDGSVTGCPHCGATLWW